MLINLHVCVTNAGRFTQVLISVCCVTLNCIVCIIKIYSTVKLVIGGLSTVHDPKCGKFQSMGV